VLHLKIDDFSTLEIMMIVGFSVFGPSAIIVGVSLKLWWTYKESK
jgi:hypothetical protein